MVKQIDDLSLDLVDVCGNTDNALAGEPLTAILCAAGIQFGKAPAPLQPRQFKVYMDAGNYYAVETKCPSEFKLDSTPHYFTMKDDGTGTTLTVTNEAFSGILSETTADPKSFGFRMAAEIIAHRKWGRLNNIEFIMNRAYALNRDKLKCKVCGGWLIDCTPWAHRIKPHLPLNKVNRVNNLVSLHKKSFDAVNNPGQDFSQFDVKVQKKIIDYREKLVPSHTCNN